METNKNKLWILLGVILVVLIIIIVAATQSQKNTNVTNNDGGDNQGTEISTSSAPSAAVEVDRTELIPVASTTDKTGKEVVSLKDAVTVAPGANPITTDDKVVTSEGVQTENEAQPMSDNAPKQTGFLDKATLPSSLVSLNIDTVFTPNKFKTKAGAPTSFSLTGTDDFSHVIAFRDASLNAIAILVGPAQTKAITFNAPTTPGTYEFYDASPDRTAVGQMIVE